MSNEYVQLAIFTLLAYCIGNISPAILLGKVYGVDIKKEGSGNAGTTNVLRVLGAKAAVITLIIDILKGFVAVTLGMNHIGVLGAMTCFVGVVFGHIFPALYRFKGGKGVATSLGAAWAINWPSAFALILIAVIFAAASKKMSVGSLAAAMAYPLLILYYFPKALPVAIFMALVVIIAHRANIKRLANGTEKELHIGHAAEKAKKALRKADEAMVEGTPEFVEKFGEFSKDHDLGEKFNLGDKFSLGEKINFGFRKNSDDAEEEGAAEAEIASAEAPVVAEVIDEAEEAVEEIEEITEEVAEAEETEAETAEEIAPEESEEEAEEVDEETENEVIEDDETEAALAEIFAEDTDDAEETVEELIEEELQGEEFVPVVEEGPSLMDKFQGFFNDLDLANKFNFNFGSKNEEEKIGNAVITENPENTDVAEIAEEAAEAPETHEAEAAPAGPSFMDKLENLVNGIDWANMFKFGGNGEEAVDATEAALAAGAGAAAAVATEAAAAQEEEKTSEEPAEEAVTEEAEVQEPVVPDPVDYYADETPIVLSKDEKKKIAVIGAGSFGTSVANVLAHNGHNVIMYGRNKSTIEELKDTKVNSRHLPGVILCDKMHFTPNIRTAASNRDMVIFAVPAQQFDSVAQKVARYIGEDTIVVNLAKGIESSSLKTMSQVAEKHFSNPYVVLSGPSHAEEIARNYPTTVVAASKDKKAAELVQNVFMRNTFRVYTTSDVLGVELGGALKNVIAIGTGIADGMKFGDNAKAAIMTRGIHEITRLGEKMGADSETFAGLSGIGDLMVTCSSDLSRNRRCGILIGQGIEPADAVEKIGSTVEGFYTVDAACALAKKHNVEMPIATAVKDVIEGDLQPRDAVSRLMGRDKKEETK